MPSLDYIEKLTGIKEEWIQNLKETESALVWDCQEFCVFSLAHHILL